MSNLFSLVARACEISVESSNIFGLGLARGLSAVVNADIQRVDEIAMKERAFIRRFSSTNKLSSVPTNYLRKGSFAHQD
jgi:hypothetical protein